MNMGHDYLRLWIPVCHSWPRKSGELSGENCCRVNPLSGSLVRAPGTFALRCTHLEVAHVRRATPGASTEHPKLHDATAGEL